MSTNVTMIGEVPIFGLLDDEEREALAQMMDSRDFKEGETVFHYGDPGGEIFILRNGQVELYVENTEGEKLILSENEQGDVIGELSFLDGAEPAPPPRSLAQTRRCSVSTACGCSTLSTSIPTLPWTCSP
jgi:CRP-like cAMP-binding protein